VHVNGRSLYINKRMVAVGGGNVLHHVKRVRERSGRGKCPVGICPRGECPGGNVRIPYGRRTVFGRTYFLLICNSICKQNYGQTGTAVVVQLLSE